MAKTAVIHGQQRWEYVSVTKRTETALEKELNELGQAGWELVSVQSGKDLKGELAWNAFLKRPSGQHAPSASAHEQKAASGPATSQEAGKAGAAESHEGFDLSGEEFGLKES